MGVVWPWFLLLLLLVPAFVLAYVWILRRRKRFAVSYSSLALIREAMPKHSQWRRHIPFALFLLTLTSLIFALARPYASVLVPSSRATILLALDVSLSMCSSDIPPNRLAVAQEAAESFIRNQEPGTQIGIVAFAGYAELIAPPTSDTEVLLEAVRNLTTARRTAIGSAILRSIDAIAEVNEEVAPVNIYLSSEEPVFTPIPEGQFQPDIIVLLTDGASNRGSHPLDAAQAAVDRGIRVYTIGFGTPQGATFRCTQEQLGGIEFGSFGLPGGFGPGGGFGGGSGGRFRRGIDEETLKEVSALTDAEYYAAESADELLEVFADVPSHLVTSRVKTEISAIFTGIGALLALATVALSLKWNTLP